MDERIPQFYADQAEELEREADELRDQAAAKMREAREFRENAEALGGPDFTLERR